MVHVDAEVGVGSLALLDSCGTPTGADRCQTVLFIQPNPTEYMSVLLPRGFSRFPRSINPFCAPTAIPFADPEGFGTREKQVPWRGRCTESCVRATEILKYLQGNTGGTTYCLVRTLDLGSRICRRRDGELNKLKKSFVLQRHIVFDF